MFHDFVAKCLTKEPRLRPTAAEMLKVVFLVNVCMFYVQIGIVQIFYFIFFLSHDNRSQWFLCCFFHMSTNTNLLPSKSNRFPENELEADLYKMFW